MGDEKKEPFDCRPSQKFRNYQVRWPKGLPKVRELTAFTALQISCVHLAELGLDLTSVPSAVTIPRVAKVEVTSEHRAR